MESNYVEIDWDLWGTLPHSLPQRKRWHTNGRLSTGDIADGYCAIVLRG